MRHVWNRVVDLLGDIAVPAMLSPRLKEACRLTALLAERLQEALADRPVEVVAEGLALRVTWTGGNAGGVVVAPGLAFVGNGTNDDRLRQALTIVGEALREYVCPGGAVTVAVNADVAVLGWSPPEDSGQMVIRLRPIKRVDVGV